MKTPYTQLTIYKKTPLSFLFLTLTGNIGLKIDYSQIKSVNFSTPSNSTHIFVVFTPSLLLVFYTTPLC